MSLPPDRRTLLRFLSQLGQAELAAGNAVALIERDLGQIAKRNGVENMVASVLPTVMFLQLDDGDDHRVQMALGPYRSGGLRFDQIEGVLMVAREARAGTLTPADGIRRLEAVQKMKHRYRDIGFVAGYLITTIGVALMLRPTVKGVGYVAGLGFLCALLLVLVRRQPAWSAVMPVVASFLVASLVAFGYKMGLREPAMDLLIPPLIVFLPGSMLTVAIVELAFANMVSGATRLVAGFAQLILLAFGILGGFRVFGGAIPDIAPQEPGRLAVWLPWLGVLLFALGLHLYKSSRPRSVLWMTFTMAMAYLGQTLAGLFLDGSSTAFFGAALMTITALTIEYRFNGPPALVTFLPAFWLLAPGAFGLASVAGIAMHNGGTADKILQLFFTLSAIAMGCLIGAFLYSGLFHIRRVTWFRKDALSPPMPTPNRFPEKDEVH
jgi:uncharacterized membrane protein YjjP (DUF1212 family)/uncharacterized membrane protein YjjB (DUF3815 family)